MRAGCNGRPPEMMMMMMMMKKEKKNHNNNNNNNNNSNSNSNNNTCNMMMMMTTMWTSCPDVGRKNAPSEWCSAIVLMTLAKCLQHTTPGVRPVRALPSSSAVLFPLDRQKQHRMNASRSSNTTREAWQLIQSRNVIMFIFNLPL